MSIEIRPPDPRIVNGVVFRRHRVGGMDEWWSVDQRITVRIHGARHGTLVDGALAGIFPDLEIAMIYGGLLAYGNQKDADKAIYAILRERGLIGVLPVPEGQTDAD